MRWLCICAFMKCLVFGSEICEDNPLYCPWLAYYGGEASGDAFKPFNPIVLKPHLLTPRKLGKNKLIFAYVNVGEIRQTDTYFEEAQKQGYLLSENPRERGTFFADLRKKGWAQFVIGHLIPDLIVEGCQGIFLDSLDAAFFLEEEAPENFKGIKNAAVQLVRLIHAYYPPVLLMVNKTYDVLQEIGSSIFAVVVDGSYTTFQQDNTYSYTSAESYEKKLKIIKEASRKFPHLQLLSLDYWYPNQQEEIKKIYALQRDNGFKPYVGEAGLKSILMEAP